MPTYKSEGQHSQASAGTDETAKEAAEVHDGKKAELKCSVDLDDKTEESNKLAVPIPLVAVRGNGLFQS